MHRENDHIQRTKRKRITQICKYVYYPQQTNFYETLVLEVSGSSESVFQVVWIHPRQSIPTSFSQAKSIQPVAHPLSGF